MRSTRKKLAKWLGACLVSYFLTSPTLSLLAENAVLGKEGEASLMEPREILRSLHHTSLREIQAGKLAEKKGYSVLVRSYGDRLARDNRLASSVALHAAGKLGIAMPAEPEEAGADLASLDRLSGRDFDQEFLRRMVEGHLQTVTWLSARYEEQPRGSELRSLLGKLLPLVRQHLQVAENLRPWI